MGFSRSSYDLCFRDKQGKETTSSQHQTVMNKHFCCHYIHFPQSTQSGEAGEHQVCGHPNLGVELPSKSGELLKFT